MDCHFFFCLLAVECHAWTAGANSNNNNGASAAAKVDQQLCRTWARLCQVEAGSQLSRLQFTFFFFSTKFLAMDMDNQVIVFTLNG